MDEETHTLELREPASPESLVPAVGATPWIVGGILLLVLIAALVIRRSMKKRLAAHPAAARRAAYLEAGNALEKVDAATAREAAVRCSLILRRYLAAAAGDPALFETHEEFIARHDALADHTPVARQACAEGFARLAALKYAPVPPETEPQVVVTDARTLLDAIHEGHPES